MFDGMQRRIVSMWFPRLPTDRALRLCPIDAPFALSLRHGNTDRIHDLNRQAETQGLHRGMTISEARVYCSDLRTRQADPVGDRRFLTGLRRWALRYCPWVGIEDTDGLTLDISGAAHLFGGEEALLADMRARLDRAGIEVRLGLADGRGAAWALSHFGEGIAAPVASETALSSLPVAALQIEPDTIIALQRFGLNSIGALAAAARAPLGRRFGPGLLTRLDQALGRQSESITPLTEPPHYAVRLTLPEPIGLTADVMAGLERLLQALCAKLKAHEAGARVLCLTLLRVDQHSQTVPLRLAAAMRDPARILPLFVRGIEDVDSGFGIDQLRLAATVVEPLPLQQIGQDIATPEQLDNLITRIGTRIGLDNIRRFQPLDSHIPERSFQLVPVADSQPRKGWLTQRQRPLRLFPPEPVTARGSTPPERFRWRRMSLSTGRAIGPERIAPEWWVEDDGWRSGIRDYWRVETHQGRRLWMYYTPQRPAWFVQGEFP
ncbi:DNA polymerase Y family protein [Paracoccus sp. PAR01]|uniref:Y-family DNA polymerase n=1 Tax=Paracoccus sp. PAR01 TaxID=2769282 RepID=UPI001786CCDF|nr:DNA polymerase Y family protein [Paracoccus sp. PAR01]MBD9527991.1 DNA polymerase Y family protein [Paracoccus sp. PAR01]